MLLSAKQQKSRVELLTVLRHFRILMFYAIVAECRKKGRRQMRGGLTS